MAIYRVDKAVAFVIGEFRIQLTYWISICIEYKTRRFRIPLYAAAYQLYFNGTRSFKEIFN